ncbi:MAG: PUR family DNA/RNA-binding protein [Bacteroidaceae bacterium]|nr:PUR family DNA/RNA-binding protein [Bacteroidaceae bacterium]
MEDSKKASESKERDILFSKTVKAGQRIYYIDVKQNRKEEMYLSITESKKILTGSMESPQVNYEKHKIFIYREDFQKFRDSLVEAMDFIEGTPEKEEASLDIAPEMADIDEDEIKIDLEF